MEFADLGAHCQYDLCRQQTYTPFYCDDCSKPYCQHHRTAIAHECISLKKQLLHQNNEYEMKEQSKTLDPSHLPDKVRLPNKCQRKGCKKSNMNWCNAKYVVDSIVSHIEMKMITCVWK